MLNIVCTTYYLATQYYCQELFLGPRDFPAAIMRGLLFGIAEFRRRMQRQIIPERHFAFLDLLGDMLGVLLRVIPFGKIQMPAPLVDISRHQPRCGRDVGIPSPSGLIAMAIEAGAVE